MGLLVLTQRKIWTVSERLRQERESCEPGKGVKIQADVKRQEEAVNKKGEEERKTFENQGLKGE